MSAKAKSPQFEDHYYNQNHTPRIYIDPLHHVNIQEQLRIETVQHVDINQVIINAIDIPDLNNPTILGMFCLCIWIYISYAFEIQ